MSASTCSPSRGSASNTSSSSALLSIDSPAWIRFSTRARFRPSSCAASGLSQKPGADMSRSISPSDLRAEATSKVTPDRGDSVFQFGDPVGGVFSHVVFLKIKFEVRGANEERRTESSSFLLRTSNLELLPCCDRNERRDARHPSEPVPESYIRRHRMSRLEIGVDDPLAVHGQLLHHAAAG